MTFKRAPHLYFYCFTTRRPVPFVVVFTSISYSLHTSLTFLAHSQIHLSTIRAALDVTITAAAQSGGAWDETIARSSRVVFVDVLWFHRYTMTSDGCSMRLVGSCKHCHRLGYSRDLCDACLCTFFIRAYHNVQWIFRRWGAPDEHSKVRTHSIKKKWESHAHTKAPIVIYLTTLRNFLVSLL